jgi:hypothetical protein
MIYPVVLSLKLFEYCVDVEDRCKPTHQRGSWTLKRSHKTYNAARDEA